MYVKLEGNLPYYVVNDPAMIGDFNVYGKVSSINNSYLGEEFVPVINVVYTEPSFLYH